MRRDREAGYVLFGIAIGLVILGISMTAAVPLWQKIVQREREKELIFRGYQYMQAIELYQRKFPGAYPPNVEILIEGKFLRREYKDPFAETEDGSFRFIRQLSPELQQGAQQQQEAAARAAGITDTNRSRAKLTTPGQPTPGAAGSTRQLTGGRFQSTLGRGASDQSMGGIVGVASASDEETFYKVPGKEKYKDWLFVYGAQQQAGGTAVVTQQRGQPGGQAGQAGGRVGQGGQLGQLGQVGAQSPFPGLPPPPGLTSFRFGSGSAGPGGFQQGQGGQILPGQPGSGARPGQQPGFRQPGTAGPQQRNQRRQP
ncbi:MAG: hypothetical protein BMS9Abin37_1068 [Acidobacteriota bacterium]|nr:MAG: hypothetical protein BMS9Abin37_1068 [Acidobacteriota bacterium]